MTLVCVAGAQCASVFLAVSGGMILELPKQRLAAIEAAIQALPRNAKKSRVRCLRKQRLRQLQIVAAPMSILNIYNNAGAKYVKYYARMQEDHGIENLTPRGKQQLARQSGKPVPLAAAAAAPMQRITL